MNEGSKTKTEIAKLIYNFIPATIIIFVLGFVVGAWVTNNLHSVKITDSIKLQRFLHKNIVYNITPNIDINK
jgi:hypothetical protein